MNRHQFPKRFPRLAGAAHIALLAALITVTAAASSTAQMTARQTRVEVKTPKTPTAVVGDGSRIVGYELHVTSFDAGPLQLLRLDISNASDGTPVASYADSALKTMLSRPGHMTDADARRISSGSRVIVFIWLTFPPNARIPSRLRHRLTFATFDSLGAQSGESSIDSIDVPVSTKPVPVLSPPFRGGEWLTGSGPSNTSDHRRTVMALNGAGHNAQRFAIDWVKVGPNGNTYHDTPTRNENFWAYGEPIHAVADGVVTEIVDSIQENIPRVLPKVVTIQNIAGNHVVIRIASGQYVMFAHLKPGSIRVRLNQRVKRGEVIALVGNTGQSTGPHMHFQVTDGSSPFASEGVPFVFDSFNFLGFGRDFEENKHPNVPRRLQMPIDDMVVGFR